MRTTADIQAELDLVSTAIAQVLGGGVSSFTHEGGDSASLLKLKDLREHRAALQRELASAQRGVQPRFMPATRY